MWRRAVITAALAWVALCGTASAQVPLEVEQTQELQNGVFVVGMCVCFAAGVAAGDRLLASVGE